MKLKPRAMPRIKIKCVRVKGDYVDGIFEEKNNKEFEIEAGVQPYSGIHLTSDKDLQWIKSSILLFTTCEIQVGDKLIYHDKDFIIKKIDSYYLGNLAHFEAIAFEYDKDLM